MSTRGRMTRPKREHRGRVTASRLRARIRRMELLFKVEGDQVSPARPVNRCARSLRLLRHGDEEASLATFHQEDQRVLVLGLGDGVAYVLYRLHGLAIHLADEVATL
jgi:hypothetical protein